MMGLILRPGRVKVKCAYPFDANSKVRQNDEGPEESPVPNTFTLRIIHVFNDDIVSPQGLIILQVLSNENCK